ncbi:hypothetical protein ACQ4M4_11345 [Leptolyngbya sp. AN02str]|uniref:hypothetical protein n=1 Tax=Leptolyngbya sp. AN02str TaxID=3423363 RepID=UPI003D310BF3
MNINYKLLMTGIGLFGVLSACSSTPENRVQMQSLEPEVTVPGAIWRVDWRVCGILPPSPSERDTGCTTSESLRSPKYIWAEDSDPVAVVKTSKGLSPMTHLFIESNGCVVPTPDGIGLRPWGVYSIAIAYMIPNGKTPEWELTLTRVDEVEQRDIYLANVTTVEAVQTNPNAGAARAFAMTEYGRAALGCTTIEVTGKVFSEG